MTDTKAEDHPTGHFLELPNARNARVKLLTSWRNRALLQAHAHFRASEISKRRSLVNTILILLCAVATLFLSTAEPGTYFTISRDLAALTSFSVLMLTIADFLFGFRERAAQHRRSAEGFSSLSRKIERYFATQSFSPNQLHSLNRQLNYLAASAPVIPRRIADALKSAQENRTDLEQSTHILLSVNVVSEYPTLLTNMFTAAVIISFLGIIALSFGIAYDIQAFSLGGSFAFAIGATCAALCIIRGEELQAATEPSEAVSSFS